MLRIGITGTAGRMGKTLVQAIQARENMQLSLALEQADNSSLGKDAGVVAGVEHLDVPITSQLLADTFDVLIDFTLPEATIAHVEQCASAGRPIVIGTTGLTDSQLTVLQQASESIPIVFAPNMSVGVNVCLKLLKTAAEAFGNTVDIEVVEAHHRAKIDAPSGTALKMGEVVADALGRSLKDDGVFARHGRTGARERNTIGFSTIRGGDIVGDHTVMFIGDGERVEITHRSNSRMTYASGALRAAAWVVEQPRGLYGMSDILSLG